MSLPIKLNHRPRVWRSNPAVIPIRCWSDRKKTVPVDLTSFGSTWASQIRASYDGPLVATFTVALTTVTYQGSTVTNGLLLTLPGDVTSALTDPFYVFDVEVTGGGVSPLTVFLGGFIVDGDVTRSP